MLRWCAKPRPSAGPHHTPTVGATYHCFRASGQSWVTFPSELRLHSTSCSQRILAEIKLKSPLSVKPWWNLCVCVLFGGCVAVNLDYCGTERAAVRALPAVTAPQSHSQLEMRPNRIRIHLLALRLFLCLFELRKTVLMSEVHRLVESWGSSEVVRLTFTFQFVKKHSWTDGKMWNRCPFHEMTRTELNFYVDEIWGSGVRYCRMNGLIDRHTHTHTSDTKFRLDITFPCRVFYTVSWV